MRRIFTLLFVLALLQTGWGQLSEGGLPYSFRNNMEQAPPVYTTPAIDVPSLLAEDEKDLKSNLPLRFAFGHAVQLNLQNTGLWQTLDNGDRIWRLTIHCPDAVNINLLYSDFFLPRGARLHLYDGGKEQVLGAFTERNNKDNRRFATALVDGEYLILEYYEPAAVRGQGSIQIAQIGHGYRDLGGTPGFEKASGACQVDVNCSEGDAWQNQKKGVARIVMDGLYLCSGSLVNNTANNCEPLFLTANHCIMGGIKQDAIINPDVSGYVFYWNYEVPDCNAGGSPPIQTTTGGTVLANSGPAETGTHTLLSSDFALIKLAENPRGAYDVYFNGWDASGKIGTGGVGIHHPAGDVKKISTHSMTPVNDGYYWELYWKATANGHSVTEGGSSGSPLFRETGLIVGQLYGGSSVNCSDPANDLGMYGRLDYSWTNDDEPLNTDKRRRLKDWLDPIGSGTIRVMPGAYNPCDVPQVYFKQVSATVSEESASTSDGCRTYSEYTYQIGITPYPKNGNVTVQLFADGSADAGAENDYQLMTPAVTFSSLVNSRSFKVRVYNDAYVEDSESITIGFNIQGNADAMAARSSMTLNINSGDAVPAAHVQTVRNTNNPGQAFLGPFGKVYYRGAGGGGIMIAVENLSSHSYGCTSVAVDNAGGSANNDWNDGTTTSKTLIFTTDNPSASAAVRVTLYYDDNEINAWTWFNDQGLTVDDLDVLAFDGAAVPANQGSARAAAATTGSYGSGEFTFTADLAGLSASTGLTMGSLSGAGIAEDEAAVNKSLSGEAQVMSLQPTLTRSATEVVWTAEIEQPATLQVFDANGKMIHQNTLRATPGLNRFSLNVNSYPTGTYFVRLINADGTNYHARMVKQ